MASADHRKERPVWPASERPIGNGAEAGFVVSATSPTEFTPVGKPDGYEWMERKTCFRNAFTLATSSSSLLYGEGFALYPLSGDRAVWVHHAWVIDPDGNAVDVTWRRVGRRYIGIGISPGELNARQLRKQRSHLVELVLATMLPLVSDLAAVTWDLADWFARPAGQVRDAGPSLEAE